MSKQDELEKIQEDLAQSFREFLQANPNYSTGASSEIAAEHFMVRVQALIDQERRGAVIDELSKLNKGTLAEKCCAVHHNLAERLYQLKGEK